VGGVPDYRFLKSRGVQRLKLPPRSLPQGIAWQAFWLDSHRNGSRTRWKSAWFLQTIATAVVATSSLRRRVCIHLSPYVDS
jgi:hypothetical protein